MQKVVSQHCDHPQNGPCSVIKISILELTLHPTQNTEHIGIELTSSECYAGL